MTINSGERMYDISAMVKTALAVAATTKSILARFQCCGIWIYSPAIFKKLEFADSKLTYC